ncbi:ABC transporter permease [Candidatus Contubernalis alkaliaceticus]|uniref:ABC transporter permease n=1 Tax=Candidatus Contubernalis alkaliaceticus TaxID=338645 RepID=UPI001F4C34B3|nr:ABC transporter permease [Candidatus Contubernalis alkalaceticus]UNC92616.1 ABC transporter permease [Candidatus Contubernalis alkalaceticus]
MRVLILGLKDVKSLTANKKEILLHIFLPVLIVAMIAALFAGEPALYGEALLVNHDGEGMADIFIERLEEERGIRVLITDLKEAQRRLTRSEVLMFTEIPSGFTDTLSRGEPAEISVYRRGVGGSTGQMLLTLIKTVLSEMSGEVQITHLVQDIAAEQGEGIFQEEDVISTFMESFLYSARLNPTVKVEEVSLGKQQDMTGFFIPGVITLFIIFSSTYYAQNFVEEKNNKIMERYFFAGLSRGQILCGKFLGIFFRGLLQLLIIMLAAVIFTKMFCGNNFFGILLFSLFFIAAVSSVSILIGCVFPKPGQALWAAIIFSMVNSALGNTFALPRADIELVRYINYLTVSYYANDGLRQLTTGNGLFFSLWGEILVLIFMTVFFLAVSLCIFSPAEK